MEGGAELWGHLVWVCFTSCDTGFREGAAELGTPRLETEGPSAEVGAPTGVCEVGAAPVGVFSRGTTRISGSLSCGAREVRSPCAWRVSGNQDVSPHQKLSLQGP